MTDVARKPRQHAGRRRGNQGETAAHRRARQRAEVVEEQERRALELFVRGLTYAEIAYELTVGPTTAWTYVQRGLKRRADVDSEIAEKARALLQLQIEALMGAWMPRALGGAEGRSGEKTPPDPRAADVMDKLIRRYAEITGALAPIQVQGEVVTRPASIEEATDQILAKLARMSAKENVIEGHLADAGHTRNELTTGQRDTDAPPAPYQEKAA